MALFIEIIEGTDKGQRFHIKSGIRLGRTTGDILVNDAKVSSLHAQIEKDGKGQLILVDRDSSNGLRINGERVQRIAMMPGVSFQIGKTFFKVIQLFGEDPQESAEEPQGWQEVLKEQVPRIPSQNRTGFTKVQAFSQAIQLEFLEGVQSETKLVIGYGPRKVGGDVLDIEIQEPLSPDIAFELIPDDAGVVFRTNYPDIVRLNDVATSSETLNAGDKIRIGNSLIEVTFLP